MFTTVRLRARRRLVELDADRIQTGIDLFELLRAVAPV